MSGISGKKWFPAALLTIATLLVWLPVLDNGFVDYDDRTYVTENPHVQRGLSAASIGWAFSAYHAANWHPLTWLTHMADWSLHGEAARGHHRTNLLLHLANTLLLFLLLARATGAAWRAALVAALFALHPLHVESVAWIAERKDVLSTFFWLLALVGWVAWTRRPTRGGYLLVAVAMAASLMSKPMAVTLPLTLLLLDAWPLGRAGDGGITRWRELVIEKLPLFALSAISSVVTLLAQSAGGAVRGLDTYGFPVRLANAAVAYATYLWKTIVPVDLAVIYPHPGNGIALWKVVVAALFLAGASVLAVRRARQAPYLAVGWLWYVVTLVPVIGLVQVGQQAMADRYTYVPLIGIFVAVAWAIPKSIDPRLATAVAAIVLIALAWGTRRQLEHWRDAESLFSHALAVTENNHVAHTNLGVALDDRERYAEAIEHYEAALALRPNNPIMLVNLGNANKHAGRLEAALSAYRRALEVDPGSGDGWYNLGGLLEDAGRAEEAIAAYEKALEIDPNDAQAHNNLGTLLARRGRLDEAIEHFMEAIRSRPNHGKAHANLAGALLLAGRPAEAWEAVGEARRNGFEPPAALVRDLRSRMPEP